MKKQNFDKLCKIIIETDGNPSTKQVENCGYPFEAFLRICNCDREKLVKEVKKIIEKEQEK